MNKGQALLWYENDSSSVLERIRRRRSMSDGCWRNARDQRTRTTRRPTTSTIHVHNSAQLLQLAMSIVILFLLHTVSATTNDIILLNKQQQQQQGDTTDDEPFRYNICNGLSNQLLYHAANIALAIQNKQAVEIPNYFIVDGVQHSDDNVLPSLYNSVPFATAFDVEYFLAQVQTIGNNNNISAKLVDFDFTAKEHHQIPCKGMDTVKQASPAITLAILQSFRPSATMKRIIDNVQSNIPQPIDKGVCFHHRDGQDWQDHCKRWSAIKDGIYRGNCLLEQGKTVVDSLRVRGLHDTTHWIYYAGDHAVPEELQTSGYSVFTRDQLLSSEDQDAMQSFRPPETLKPKQSLLTLGKCALGLRGCSVTQQPSARDLWALLDFFICGSIHGFVGNSVSTFSALQIALREGKNAYWYNSQSIPLAGLLPVYYIPIVYTYSERSQFSEKYLLQASIVSVKKNMPRNKIHVLYHGENDREFIKWLESNGAMVHLQSLDQLMISGAEETFSRTQLLQRFDIPNIVSSEYILLLDADTIVLQPFTLADFGHNLTRGIGMSSAERPINKAENAGVTVMNVPYLRETQNDFSTFVKSFMQRDPLSPATSEEGAHLEFYNVSFLSRRFNFKPFWSDQDILRQSPFIAHFYKARPHGYIKHSIGDSCMFETLCDKALLLPSLCRVMQVFAKTTKEAIPGPSSYCLQSFPNQTMALVCDEVLDELATLPEACTDLTSVVRRVLVRKGAIYAELQFILRELNRQVDRIYREQEATVRMQQERAALEQLRSYESNHSSFPSFVIALLLPWTVIIFALASHYEKVQRRMRRQTLLRRSPSSLSTVTYR